MNAITPIHAHSASQAAPVDPAVPVRRFVADHYDALWHAARLLGGYEAAREVGHLATALANEPTLSRSTGRRLHALLDLLMLENVGDPERVEMGFFAVIDPSDPCVEEICLLADGLAEAVADWQTAQRNAPRRGSAPVPHPQAG